MNYPMSKDASQSAATLIAAIEELLSATAGSKGRIPENDLENLCLRVQSARIGFPLSLEECAPRAVNRLGGVLLGPVFTSRAHPWPVDENGNPMAPLCQVFSAHFPVAINGVDGLVQVWMSQSDSGLGKPLIRVIPTAEAEAALMTPVISHGEAIEVLLPEAADWLRDFHSGPKPSKNEYITAAAVKLGHDSANELADADWDQWMQLSCEYGDKYGEDVVQSWQIAGFEEGRVYCDITEDQNSAMVSLEKLLKKLEKNVANSDEELVRLLAKTCSAYKDWASQLGDQTYPCLLGTFQEIQYCAANKDMPLICFESIGMREWGDGGNAQVFFSKENGLSFDWSGF